MSRLAAASGTYPLTAYPLTPDLQRAGPRVAGSPSPVFCFSVVAEASAGLLPRVLQFFAKRDLLPARCHATVTGRDAQDLEIDLQVGGLDSVTAERIACGLRQVFGVRIVLLSEKA